VNKLQGVPSMYLPVLQDSRLYEFLFNVDQDLACEARRSKCRFIGGPSKCCKSYLGIDMALSVATGTPCLGTYAVLESGPALIYLAEDSLSVVRERVLALATHRGLTLDEINLHVITALRLRLDQSGDRARLFETARRIRSRLPLLDPLVRLHAVDENNATEVSQLLSGMRDLQRRLDLAVVLVHHTRKSTPAGMSAGQGLRGSTDLHAFGDSNLYLRRLQGRLILSMEHRAAAAPEPVGLQLVTADPRTIHLEVAQRAGVPNTQDREATLAQGVLDALEHQPAMSRQALRDELAVKNERLGRVLVELEHQGRIERCGQGWRSGEKPGDRLCPRRARLGTGGTSLEELGHDGPKVCVSLLVLFVDQKLDGPQPVTAVTNAFGFTEDEVEVGGAAK
ncbi:MAG: AAA family ATPase, partial [Phycisphaerae bacterium]